MQYLGTQKITPNNVEIEVECYGDIQPYEPQTSEHPGSKKHASVEEVRHCDVVITDYLSWDILEMLEIKINEL